MARKNDPQVAGILEYLQQNYKRTGDASLTTTLGPEHLAFVRQAMACVMTHWYDIGLQWGMDPDDLDKIRTINRRDLDGCFTDMIAGWLSQENLKGSSPTWEEVVIAMADPASGKNPAAARRLAEFIVDNGVESLCCTPEANGVDDRQMEYPNALKDVTRALKPVSAKLNEIGVILGLDHNTLKSIQSCETVDERMEKVAKKWLKSAGKKKGNRFGVPSWKKLVGAIAAKTGGGNSVYAREIAQQHPAGPGQPADSSEGHSEGIKRQCLETTNGRPDPSQNGSSNGHVSATATNGNGHCATSQAESHVQAEQPPSMPEVRPYLTDLETSTLLNLGGELGLNAAHLKKIEPVQLAMDLCLSWLRADYNVLKVSGKPTWKSLAKALKDVGANGVATKIEEDKIKT